MADKRVALVTGGSSGIGLAIVKKFVQEGYLVIATGRNQEKLNAALKEFRNSVFPFVFDMNWLERIPGYVSDLLERFQRIDILVNNAGINQKKPFLETTDQDYQNILLTNQIGLFALTREVAKVMVKQEQKGSIINISSMTAIYGLPKVISYSASKTALDGMTRALSVELGPMGIRVNSIAPGFITTAMTSAAFDRDPKRKQRVLLRTPLGRMGQTDEVANAVYFLASEEASFITGVVLPVDGGNSIGF